MRSTAWAVCLGALVGFGAGCGERHSVKAPAAADAQAPVDIGPIVDESGVDVGPVVAARMRERRLGAARYTAAPGQNPYVSGRVRVEDGDAGTSGTVLPGAALISVGALGLIVGGTFYALGPKDDLDKTGVKIGLAGAVALVGGIVLLAQPSRYRQGEIVADLELRRGQWSVPIQQRDRALVRHGMFADDEAGGPILDGVVNAIANQTTARQK